jgi:hypothetical protein
MPAATTLATAGLAARHHHPAAAVPALRPVAAPAIGSGPGLLKVFPPTWITRAAAAAGDVSATDTEQFI